VKCQRMPGRMNGLGGAIWRARMRLGLSREGLAERLGFKAASVRQIETSWWPLRRTTLDRCARALGMSVEELVAVSGRRAQYLVDAPQSIRSGDPT
jgi:ribosome-binding protein aMBF1 (putative translation factor)